jgi:uncharacterized membrane protein YccC
VVKITKRFFNLFGGIMTTYKKSVRFTTGIGVGLGIGTALGVGFGSATGDMGWSLAMGIALGVIGGIVIDPLFSKKARP